MQTFSGRLYNLTKGCAFSGREKFDFLFDDAFFTSLREPDFDGGTKLEPVMIVWIVVPLVPEPNERDHRDCLS
jgi:hypothetical protein